MPDLPQLTRRTALRLLTIGALAAVTGCRPTRPRAAPPSATVATPSASHSSAGTTAGPTPTTDSADELLVKRVADAERALLAAYDTAAADHPELVDRLAPLRADHAAHLQGLVPGAKISTSPSIPVSSAPAASAAPPPTAGPSASGLVLDQLAALERSAAAARITDVVASTGSLARLLASIGGCEAGHAALLAARA